MTPWTGGLLTTHKQQTTTVQIWTGHYHLEVRAPQDVIYLIQRAKRLIPRCSSFAVQALEEGWISHLEQPPHIGEVKLGHIPPTSRGKGDVGTAQNHKNHPALVFGTNLWSLFLCLFVWWGSLGTSWRLPAWTAEQALSCAEEAPFQPALHAHTQAGCLLPFMMVFFVYLIVDLIFTSAIKKPNSLSLSWILAAVRRGGSREAKTPCFQEPKAPNP